MCQKLCDETAHCVGYTFVKVAFRVVFFGLGDCVLVVILDIMGDDDDSVVVVVVVVDVAITTTLLRF